MPKAPRLTAVEAERKLIAGGFALVRTQGSHRIYRKGTVRLVVPFHGSRVLHPKIVRQVLKALEDSSD